MVLLAPAERVARALRAAAVSDPHVPLAFGVVLVLAAEWLRGSATVNTSASWPLIQAAVAGLALFVAWRRRDGLRLIPLLVLGLGFQLAWIGIHLGLGVRGDGDATYIYPTQGEALLSGAYPRSEYPPGAVGLFALETWLGGGSTRTSNAFVMVIFQLLCVLSIWALRTRWSSWLAAFVALWPLNAFFWEFRFDLVPAAALVAGLLFAYRERWFEAGLVLGVGTVVKWSPALSVAALLLWLIRWKHVRDAGRHLLGFAIPVLLAYVPLLLWKPSEVLAAYTIQGGRTITGESLPYLPLRLLGLASPSHWFFAAAHVPGWANGVASVLQAIAIIAVTALAIRVRNRSSAVALAALVPVVFLLTNRIFSPQFFVLILAAWAVAASFVVRGRLELVLVGAVGAAATVGNAVLYPSLGARPVGEIPGWTLLSASRFLPALVVTAWLVARATDFPLERAVGRVRGPELAAALRPLRWPLAVLSAFAVIRLALFWRFPPFYDEALYAHWTLLGFENAAERFISLKDAKEPLFIWVDMIFMYLGAGPWTAVRLTSLFSGLVTLCMCGLIGRELGGRRVGLAAAALAAVVPIFVVHDVIGIMDPLATAFVASALYLQIRLARSPRLADALLLGFALGGGLLTKSTTFPAIALLPAGLLAFDWSRAGRGRRVARWVGGVVLALLLAYGLYSVMKLSAQWNDYVDRRGLVGVAEGQPAHSIGEGLAHPIRWLESNWSRYGSVLADYVSVPILVAAAIGAGLGLRRRSRLSGLILLWFVVPYAMVLLLTESAYPRYLLVGIPALLVLAASGTVAVFEWLWRLERQRLRWAASAAAAAALATFALVFDARVLAHPDTARYPGIDDEQYVRSGAALLPYEKVAQELRRLADPGELTVAMGDFTSDYLQLELRNDTNIGFVRADRPEDACSALYAVETSVPLPERAAGFSWQRIVTYPRPRDGTPTLLYETAVLENGRAARTPDQLRTLVGGTDRDFDRYIAERPCVRAWYEAWFRLHS